MFKYDAMRRNALDAASNPTSRRRVRHDGRAQGVNGATWRSTHVATVLRAVQATEGSEREIAVVLETDEALAVFVNPLFLTCTLGNLLHGAIRLSPDRSRVILRSSAVAEEVCIQIEQDHGVGEQTFRAGAGAAAAPADSLGWLVAARRMSAAMKGALSVEHRAGAGYVFSLALPFRTVALNIVSGSGPRLTARCTPPS